MSKQRIRIGFIGLNPDSHWAATAHIPALKSLSEDFEIIGVANSTEDSAKRTAEAMGLKYAFSNAEELIQCDEVDLVVVTVKVPYHYDLVKMALEAGKHVHCEWPLANGLEEAKLLTALAQERGVSNTVGTQMLTSPEVIYLKQLIADGYVGEVLSSTLIGSGANWGAQTSDELAYLYDKKNGATMVTIPFGHTLAGVQYVLGEITEVTGRLINRRNSVTVTETGQPAKFDAADQILVHGQMAGGTAFSAHYRGGMSRGTNFFWEINGTEGDIQVKGNIGHGQFADLKIYAANGDATELALMTVPTELYSSLPEAIIPRNVAGIYKKVAADIQTGSRTAPSFDDALRLHELLAEIEK